MAQKVFARKGKSKKKKRDAGAVLFKKPVNAPPSQKEPSSNSLIMQLHQTIGNRAVQRLIQSGTLQLESDSIQPGDTYSQEIDRLTQRFAAQQKQEGVIQLDKQSKTLKWDNKGKFISTAQTSPENIVKILNQLIGEGILNKVNVTNKFQNGHIIAANFGGANDRTNLFSWGDQMEEKQGDFEKTIMNGGGNSSEPSWQSYPGGGINEEGKVEADYTVSSGNVENTIKNSWTTRVHNAVKDLDKSKFQKLGKNTTDDKPKESKIKEEVESKYDNKVGTNLLVAVSRLPTKYEINYEPDSSHNPNSRPKIEYKLTVFPGTGLEGGVKDETLFKQLKPLFISDDPQRWKVDSL